MIKKLVLSLVIAVSAIGLTSIGASAEWKKDSSNNWHWTENGVDAKGWKQIGGSWYNFGNNGFMKTGWVSDGGNWYYFWSNGTMASNSWLCNGGYWYYFDASGKDVYNTVVVGDKTYDFSKPAVIVSSNNTTGSN